MLGDGGRHWLVPCGHSQGRQPKRPFPHVLSQADMDRVVCKYSLDALLHVVFAVRSALGALTYVARNIRCSDA